MKTRCYNPNEPGYHRYGGRGISICDEWLNSFETFQKWALSHGYRNDLSIDRINNDGNYEPSNCRWATAKEQANNRSTNKRNDLSLNKVYHEILSRLRGKFPTVYTQFERAYRLEKEKYE